MVLAAGLLVLLGLGLFVGGVVTGTTALYWACVAACGLAAVLLVVARVRTAREAGDFDRRAAQAPARADAAGSRPPEVRRTARQPAVPPEERAPAAEPVERTPEAPLRPAGATAVRVTEPDRAPEPAADREPEPLSARAPAEESPVEPVPAFPAAPLGNGHLADGAPARRGAHEPRETPADPVTGEPGEEDVEVTDLLLVVDLDDEVLVVDEHPRYHLPGCPSLEGREGIGLPMVEARTDGFTPCATCRPVRHLADTERSRRQAARDN
ncbi:hypothetical protein [Geodermatophilus siccatus]|uniref:hypothetical protein n=1 Tax=Geodermatophilus siccatus TaxID=1137991 RepID=UPI00111411A5|nr:hypothetical protein [Geodermatophilus siccatus]